MNQEIPTLTPGTLPAGLEWAPPIALDQLSDADRSVIQAIHQQSDHANGQMIPLLLDLDSSLVRDLGQVFLIRKGDRRRGEIVAYMICLDRLKDLDKRFLQPGFREALGFGSGLLHDLEVIGDCVFINQIAVSARYRNQGVASHLAQAVMRHYQTETKYCLAVCMVPEDNHDTIFLLEYTGFSLIDPQWDLDHESLYFRGIKILNASKFHRQLNPQNLAQAFRTLIPIQLQQATQAVNRLVRRLNGEILWSAMFQEDEILTQEYQMAKVYLGYFGMNHSLRLRGAYTQATETVKRLLDYFGGLEKDKVASLTESMMAGGFEMFVTDAPNLQREHFPSFADPVVLNIHDLDILAIRQDRHFHPSKEKLDDSEHQVMMHALDQVALLSRTPGKARQEAWAAWCAPDKLNLSPEESARVIEQAKQLKQARGKALKSHREAIRGQIHQLRKFSEKQKKNWMDWVSLHKDLYAHGQNGSSDQMTWCIAVVPMTFSERGASRLMFSFRAPLRPEDPELLNDIAYTISSALTKNMFNVQLKLRKRYSDHMQNRYSVARIMARNLSHNLGAHVITKLANPEYLNSYLFEQTVLDGGPQEISHFFRYLRTRMDLLADIATSDPVVSMPRYFKADFIDTFNRQDLLRQHITGIKKPAGKVTFVNELTPDNPQTDILIQASNGELGVSAFCIILENIIRNSAKYEDLTQTGPEEFHLKVSCRAESSTGRSYIIHIHDNILRQRESGDRNLVERINTSFIKAQSIYSKQEWERRGWGIQEMKIAAAYLRKLSFSRIDGQEHEINQEFPLIKAIEVPAPAHGEQAYYLGYELYLKKPREVLLLDAGPYVPDEHTRERYRQSGIRTRGVIEAQADPTNIYSHEIAVVLGEADRKTIEQQKTYPLRWLNYPEQAEVEKILSLLEKPVPEFTLEIWRRWLERYQFNKELLEELHLEVIQTEADLPKLLDHPADHLLVFDYHGLLLKGKGDPRRQPGDFHYYEAFSRYSHTSLLLRQQENPAHARLRLEFHEAAITDILVVDERIQEHSHLRKNRLEHQVSFVQELEMMRICQPPMETIPLMSWNAAVKAQLLAWLETTLRAQKIDFLIIHLGIIERIVGSAPKDVRDFIDEKLRAWNDRTEIVLTSGRGRPHDVPERILFLHYSNVTRYLLHEKSKFSLCKSLFAARTRLKSS